MNDSFVESVPVEYSLSSSDRQRIVVSSVLLYIGIFGNIITLVALIRHWKAGSRVHFFVAALCISDIIGIGVREGTDIGWLTTYIWTAGEAACKTCMFFYMFGNTLAHYFLVSFNVDNVVTVLTFQSNKIVRILLAAVSVIATICIQAPNAFVFNVRTHPLYPKLVQCVSFGYFEDRSSETIYLLVLQIAIYWFPLFLIILTSVPTLLTWRKTIGGAEYEEARMKDHNGSDLRTLNTDLAMVTTLNIVFLLCWTPTVVCGIVSIFGNVSTVTQKTWVVSQLLSVSNSCLNPIVYGLFACVRRRNELIAQ